MKQILISLLAAITFIATVSTLPFQTAGAVTASDWKAGRIIDDVVFTNPNEMSVADIQAFLNKLVPACDTNGTKPASEYGRPDLTHAQYAAMRGWPGPPYVCLRDYYEVPKYSPGDYIPANNFSGSIPAGAVSAAQIIHDAARINNINPKAILIKIATESAGPLTTDTWPIQSQYTYAMGSHCPDSGPGGSANCDRNYAGFSMQVSSGVGLLRWYMDSMQQSWWSYKKPYQTNSILWNVQETGCGAGDIYIESKATAALYTYTPYQPNKAALDNMYGLGDRCSAYGNRNFWRVWSDWFGSPNIPAYQWQSVSQAIYTDDTKSTYVGWNAKSFTGERVYAQVKAKNTGSSPWNKSGSNPILLATWNPQDRTSQVCDQWITCNRVTNLVEEAVEPGEVGTFEFWMKAPVGGGTYREHFNLVAEGKTWFNATGMFIDYVAESPRYTWSPGWQQAYYDSAKTKPIGWHANVIPGQKFYFVLQAKNTGNVAWRKDKGPGMLLGTWNPQDTNSPYCTPEWLRCNRTGVLQESVVNPGEIGTFEFWMQAPNKTGSFSQYFNMVAEGVTWMDAGGVFVNMSVKGPTYNWQPAGQSVWTDETKVAHLGWNGTMAPGGRNYVEIYAKNTGNVPWVKNGPNPTLIGTWNAQDRVSQFYDSSWVFKNRMAVQQEEVVYPGEIATYRFSVTAPSTPGTYKEYFNIVAESKTWLNPTGQFFTFTVK